MEKNRSIFISPQFDVFIQIDTGRYASINEVVQAALRLLEDEEKFGILLQSLIDGEKSGFVEHFDPQTFKTRMTAHNL